MDQKQLLKQMIDFNKASFDNTFNALSMLQEQAERMTKQMLETAQWLPQEGKKAINEWLKAYKKGCEEYKKLVDDRFKDVEAFFTSK